MKTKTLITLTVAALMTGVLSLARAADKAPPAKDDYPLEKCLVSDEKLGDMGEPYVMQYEGRTVKFCCKDCLKKFKKDPEKYLKILEEARQAKQAKKSETAPAPAPAPAK